jgi:hypothetical protein
VSRGEFRVEVGIPCRGGNSVSRGEFHDEGGIPCRGGNCGQQTVHLLKKIF